MHRSEQHNLQQVSLWTPDIRAEFDPAAETVLSHGDCLPVLRTLPGNFFRLLISSPPYNLGKDYEERVPFAEYLQRMEPVIDECARVVADNGSVCWQVGNYVEDGEIFPLDMYFYQMFRQRGLKLRNRMIWHYEHGQHARYRFSGRYETLLWFTKGDDYLFNLDAVRVPAKYPEKKHFRGPRHGELSGNPLGKNPGDVWELGGFADTPVFEIDEERTVLDEAAFQRFAGFVETVVRKLRHTAAEFQQRQLIARNDRELFLQAVPQQANLVVVAARPYATITVERSPRQLSVEFGRNRWVFTGVGNERKFTAGGPLERYSFAVMAGRDVAPLMALVNHTTGAPLPVELLQQLAVFRRVTYGELGVTPEELDTLSAGQATELRYMRDDMARVFLMESLLSLTLQHSRLPVPSRQPGLFGAEGLSADVPAIVTLVSEITSESGANTWQVIKRDWESAFWDIPNVKAGHVEKTIHPCQFPIELVERCVLALTSENDWVLDPFAGVGSAVVAALRRRRRGMGIEKEERFVNVARQRVTDYFTGRLACRPLGRPVHQVTAPAGRKRGTHGSREL
ncbi:MAG: DNA methyltransferase [Blastocatellia bacterium]